MKQVNGPEHWFSRYSPGASLSGDLHGPNYSHNNTKILRAIFMLLQVYSGLPQRLQM